jgi:hypothetical protein
MDEKYSPLSEGWVGRKSIDISKIKIDMSKIRPIERVIIPANTVINSPQKPTGEINKNGNQ